jgi:hypothetical protein
MRRIMRDVFIKSHFFGDRRRLSSALLQGELYFPDGFARQKLRLQEGFFERSSALFAVRPSVHYTVP